MRRASLVALLPWAGSCRAGCLAAIAAAAIPASPELARERAPEPMLPRTRRLTDLPRR